MQNRYVGDIGDFGKYGMLRFVLSKSDLRLGVNWYLVQDENHTNDGKFIEYLNPSNSQARKLAVCDQQLYRMLKDLVRTGNRTVQATQQSGILPTSTVYFDRELPYVQGPLEYHRQKRSEWFEQSLAALKDCDVLFLDPDNGLEVSSSPLGSSKAVKYALYGEVVDYYKNGYNVIIYNHRDRSEEQEYRKRFTKIKDMLGEDISIPVLEFKRSSVRHYAFILQKRDEAFFKDSVDRFVKTTWGEHFALTIL